MRRSRPNAPEAQASTSRSPHQGTPSIRGDTGKETVVVLRSVGAPDLSSGDRTSTPWFRSGGATVSRSIVTLQRFAGNGAVTNLIAPPGTGHSESGGRPVIPGRSHPTVQAAPLPGETADEGRPFRIPEEMGLAITISDFRSISFDDIASLNDDQLLDLKSRLDTWKLLYENVPNLLHEDYRKARGRSKRRQAYDLFMASAKILRAFERRYEPVSNRAERIARGRGFSIPGATFGPKPENGTEFERWVGEIEGGLGARAGQVFRAVLPEVKRRLEFLLWDIDYPTPAKSARWYWERYGYWSASVIQQVLTTEVRRTKWSDFAPFLGDAAAAIASSFAAAVETGGGPGDVIRKVEGVTGQITEGLNEVIRQGDGVLNHGVQDVNIRDLYNIAQEMRDRPGSIMSCFDDAFLYS